MQATPSVPKFGSFRPKQPTLPQASPEERDRSSESRQTGNRSTSPKKSHTRRHHGSNHDRERSGHEPRERPRYSERKAEEHSFKSKTADPQDNIGLDLFVVDRRGDIGNLQYGTNISSSIPIYRPPHERRTLGAVITPANRSSARSLLLSLSREERNNLKREPNNIVAAKGGAEETSSTTQDQEPEEVDFVPLRSGRRRRRIVILGESRPKQTSESDLDSSTDDASDADTSKDINEKNFGPSVAQKAVRQENARLSTLLKNEPQNAQAWQDYIDHQQAWVQAEKGSADGELTPAERRSIADVRLSLYSDALSKLKKDHPAREAFQLKLLHEGSKVWEGTKLATKWKDAAASNPKSLDIQMNYINFTQSSPNFSFEKCRDMYGKYLTLLGAAGPGRTASTLVRQLYAILRFTCMARDAGYQELARSVWQGLLELHLSGGHADGPEQAMAKVEDLWDSEDTRVGDTAQFDDADPPSHKHAEHPNDPESGSFSWFSREKARAKRSATPGRTTDEEDDPYRVVLFDDIKPFLIQVPPEHSMLLVDALLRHHQLPSLCSNSNIALAAWWTDPFLLKSSKNSAVELTLPKHCLSQPWTLFRNGSLPQGSDDAEFIRAVFRRLAEVSPASAELAEYYMAFLCVNFPTEARKECKSILKSQPTSLRLYNAFSMTEECLGNIAAAESVLSAALNMANPMPVGLREDAILLRQSWIWLAISGQDAPTALDRLRSITPDPAAYGKLTRGRDEAISRDDIRIAVAHSELLALEGYLVHDFDLRSALGAFRDEAAVLGTIGKHAAFAVELLHQAQARLIQSHIKHFKNYSPTTIRQALRSCVENFPSNTLFLRLFTDNESRFLIDSRVRSQLAATILSDNEPTVTSWLFYIQTEIERGATYGATEHAIRATFEKAITSKAGAHSEAVWTAFVVYEFNEAKNLEKAKAVYYRGLASVPWSKDFAMLAFELLGTVLKEEELRGVYNVMMDREMRIHVDWDCMR